MSNLPADPVILPWPEMQKKAERDGVDIMVYVNSMHAHVVRQRDEITRLRKVCADGVAQLDSNVTEIGRLNLARQQAEHELDAAVEKLAELRDDAVETVQHWGAYASQYFQEKHDLAGDIERLKGKK